MSKKHRHREKLKKKQQTKRPLSHRRKSLVVISLILCFGLTSLILAGRIGLLRTSFSPIVPVLTPTPSLSASNPSKSPDRN